MTAGNQDSYDEETRGGVLQDRPLRRKLDFDRIFPAVDLVEHVGPELLHERRMGKNERHVVVHEGVEEVRDQLREVGGPEGRAEADVSLPVICRCTAAASPALT